MPMGSRPAGSAKAFTVPQSEQFQHMMRLHARADHQLDPSFLASIILHGGGPTTAQLCCKNMGDKGLYFRGPAQAGLKRLW